METHFHQNYLRKSKIQENVQQFHDLANPTEQELPRKLNSYAIEPKKVMFL
jgi:hypothetical protein